MNISQFAGENYVNLRPGNFYLISDHWNFSTLRRNNFVRRDFKNGL